MASTSTNCTSITPILPQTSHPPQTQSESPHQHQHQHQLQPQPQPQPQSLTQTRTRTVQIQLQPNLNKEDQRANHKSSLQCSPITIVRAQSHTRACVSCTIAQFMQSVTVESDTETGRQTLIGGRSQPSGPTGSSVII